MNKSEFLYALRRGLAQLPEQEIEKQLAYYSELIDDMVEDGMNEYEATERLGDIDGIVRGVLEDTPLPLLVRTKVKPSGGWSTMNILLLVLGFPIWFPLLITFFALFITFYAVIWVLIICAFIVVLALGITAVALIISFIICLTRSVVSAIMVLGSAIAIAGITVLAYLLAVWMTKALIKGTGSLARGIKSLFIKKERYDYE